MCKSADVDCSFSSAGRIKLHEAIGWRYVMLGFIVLLTKYQKIILKRKSNVSA